MANNKNTAYFRLSEDTTAIWCSIMDISLKNNMATPRNLHLGLLFRYGFFITYLMPVLISTTFFYWNMRHEECSVRCKNFRVCVRFIYLSIFNVSIAYKCIMADERNLASFTMGRTRWWAYQISAMIVILSFQYLQQNTGTLHWIHTYVLPQNNIALSSIIYNPSVPCASLLGDSSYNS
jgi:hypothetical protein